MFFLGWDLMRFIYSSVMYLLTPFLLIRLWWKGRRLPAYRERIAERFSFGDSIGQKVDVWIHAVSLGEVIAAIPLVDALLARQYTVLITTMTPTGSERVIKRFAKQVFHQYIPYDLPLALKRFFRQTQPKVGVIMETELWPNLIHEAQVARVPLLLANARLSERSYRGYQFISRWLRPILNQFSALLTQSAEDAQRFIALGARQELVHVLGNVKFDMQTHTHVPEQFQELKALWGSERVVLIAASTHEGEEAALLNEFKRLQQVIPDVILIIAPRHPERFHSVFKLAKQLGYHTGLRSEKESLSTDNEVVVLDSLGELLGWYQISNFAFVGGSLVPVGGHNMLEPIAVQVPVITGPHTSNFKAICSSLEEAQAMHKAENAAQVMDAVINLYVNGIARQQMINNATQVLESNRGAVKRHVEKIKELLKTSL